MSFIKQASRGRLLTRRDVQPMAAHMDELEQRSFEYERDLLHVRVGLRLAIGRVETGETMTVDDLSLLLVPAPRPHRMTDVLGRRWNGLWWEKS